MSWAKDEFRGIDLGDARRDRRAVQLVERLAERPTASIPESIGDRPRLTRSIRLTIALVGSSANFKATVSVTCHKESDHFLVGIGLVHKHTSGRTMLISICKRNRRQKDSSSCKDGSYGTRSRISRVRT